MERSKEKVDLKQHAFGEGIGFHGQGARTYKIAERINLLPEPLGSNPFRFSHSTYIINVEQDWRMVEDPNHPGIYFERVMLSGTGPNAKRLHGN